MTFCSPPLQWRSNFVSIKRAGINDLGGHAWGLSGLRGLVLLGALGADNPRWLEMGRPGVVGLGILSKEMLRGVCEGFYLSYTT